MHSHKKYLANKNVSNCLLNAVNEGAEVTLAGSLFHARAVITWNQQLRIVWSRVRGVISHWQNPEHRLVALLPCRSSAGHGQVRRYHTMLWQQWKTSTASR